MDNEVAIKVEHISKKYCKSLKRSMLYGMKDIGRNMLGLSQNRVSEIIGNANFGNIDILLSQGRDMEYIARHYNMDLPLVWALRLEGKTDQEKFKDLLGPAPLNAFAFISLGPLAARKVI